MRELIDSVEIEMIRKEIRKHEIDLARAKERNGTSPEELLKLREKIDAKKYLIETVLRLTEENESYKRVLRDKLVEIQRLKLDIKRIGKEEKTA